jgi:CheY-like chemotaxis protein
MPACEVVVADLSGCRMLIIEDEILLAVMLDDMLSDLGCVCAGRASTLTEALAIVETQPQLIDAAALDLNLGGDIAQSVAHALEAYGIPFMITTGYADPALFSGFDGVPILGKPYTSQQVEQALRSFNLTCVEAA